MFEQENRQVLKKIISVKKEELPRVLSVGFLFVLVTAGVELGRIGRDSYFLTQVGADKIPLMYVIIAGLMLLISFLYGRFVDRFSSEKLMIFIQMTGILGMFGLWGILTFSTMKIELLPYIMFVGVEVYLSVLLIHYWVVVSTTFDAWEGRRVYAYIGASGLTGTLCGGLGANFVSTYFGAQSLFLSWAILLILSIPVIARVKKTKQESHISTQDTTTETDPQETTSEESGSLKAIWKQPLLRTLTYMSLPMWITIFIIEFNYYTTMDKVFISPDELASFLGIVVSVSSFVGLMLQVFITSKLLKKWGVGATSMVYPFSITIGALALLIFSLTPTATAETIPLYSVALLVVIARFCDIAIYFSVYESATQLLFYSVPNYIQGRSRAFISGFIMPVSIGIAGLLLVYFTSINEPIYNITFMSICMGLMLIILGLNITPDYLIAMLSNIDSSDSSNRQDVLKEISKLTASDAKYALIQSVTSKDEEEAMFAVDKLTAMQDDELFEDLEDIVEHIQPNILRQILSRFNAGHMDKHPDFINSIREIDPNLISRFEQERVLNDAVYNEESLKNIVHLQVKKQIKQHIHADNIEKMLKETEVHALIVINDKKSAEIKGSVIIRQQS